VFHAEYGLFGVPVGERFKLGENRFDASDSITLVGTKLKTFLIVNRPVEGVFGDVDADKVVKVHETI